MKEILERITAFADQAHGDQKRKYADERYIRHPLRVMQTCHHYGYSLPVLAAAILHDVLEDTDTGIADLRQFLLTVMNEADANYTMSLIIELTDVYTKHDYPRMNRRQRKAKEALRIESISADAQTIKYADIIDNANGMASQDADFAAVYLAECVALLEKMKSGNKELHKEAIDIVRKEMDQLEIHGQH